MQSEAKRANLVRCKVCLERPCTLNHLKKHVKTLHADEFKGNEKLPTKHWVYQESYTGTAGNDGQQKQNSSDAESDSEKESEAQANLKEERKEPPASNIFEDALQEVLHDFGEGLSQDEFENWGILTKLSD
jgi:hypothetical protein